MLGLHENAQIGFVADQTSKGLASQAGMAIVAEGLNRSRVLFVSERNGARGERSHFCHDGVAFPPVDQALCWDRSLS